MSVEIQEQLSLSAQYQLVLMCTFLFNRITHHHSVRRTNLGCAFDHHVPHIER